MTALTTTTELIQQAIQAARSGRKIEARDMLIEVVETDPQNEVAWLWLTGLVDSLEDKIIACENALTINPSNERVRAYLAELRRQENKEGSRIQQPPEPEKPLEAVNVAAPPAPAPVAPPQQPKPHPKRQNGNLRDLARQREAEGDLEGALNAYTELARQTRDAREFDRIYNEITRLEGLQKEQITHIAPTTTILRMAFGWPLLYLFLSLMQVGLNPLVHPSWYLWLGLPIVTVGGFLLALAEVRSRHRAWRALFGEEDEAGSGPARLVASIGGWMLVILPLLLLLIDSIKRLQAFHIPPMPY